LLEGTAIYIFCILVNAKKQPYGDSDMQFYLDDGVVGNFRRTAPGTNTYEYNVSVYAKEGLAQGMHTLTLQNGFNGGKAVTTLLDYIIYS
jgi:hypothetical protein